MIEIFDLKYVRLRLAEPNIHNCVSFTLKTAVKYKYSHLEPSWTHQAANPSLSGRARLLFTEYRADLSLDDVITRGLLDAPRSFPEFARGDATHYDFVKERGN